MDIAVINIDKFTEKALTKVDTIVPDRVGFEEFMYKFLSIDDELNENDILNLNLEHIDSLSYVLSKISLSNDKDNEKLKNSNAYLTLLGVYRFSSILQNLNNMKGTNGKQLVPKTFMFF